VENQDAGAYPGLREISEALKGILKFLVRDGEEVSPWV
jgi:hypothetical protein